ncbi:ent-copalyl diphosphate synthase, chloroplastic [Senna tora]|uniref:Ent-copalyl diphosphate synthase, chloroplastic n=1 Tax=Senna tora TaxID=362788 RepID=A0A834WET8_9FABA|nr:ent-copalyl diphosphate synthase, chloroplastic [Senna tora]
MGDGDISISAYDTAWVALIPDVHGSASPQFPSSLQWIVKNQLPDGSWGDQHLFSAHDRIINTLACVIALKSWNIRPDISLKGLAFFRENLCKLENENVEHMPIGFEVAFPSLLDMARLLDIQVPHDSPILTRILAMRNEKLTRIPREMMHKVPTTLLHSLEGMSGLDWKQLLKLQCEDGSFLFSPSSTAFALMQTHDHNCLHYLNTLISKFNGGDVFKQFERNGEFFCFAGQSTQAVTGMFNLYRASEVVFPGEKILEDAKKFSAKFLRDKRAANELIDKWIIMKNLTGEVAYALDVPWYASLPRVETRFYIDQYGGESDVWIGKTLYRMRNVSNNTYLELAKLDYNSCQQLHQTEWSRIQEWYSECRLGEFGLSRRSLLLAYFVAASSIYEPERFLERLAWAKTVALLEAITTYAGDEETRNAFVHKFNNYINGRDFSFGWRLSGNKTGQGLVETLLGTIDQLSWDTLVSHGHEIGYDMHHTWQKWLSSWQSGGDKREGLAELLVQIINLSAGNWISEELVFNPQYQHLLQLTNTICYTLQSHQNHMAQENGHCSENKYSTITSEIEAEMQELVQLVLQKSSNDIDSNIKNTFLTVAKSFYYEAFCDSRTINFHIAKVLFEKVI